MNLPINIADLLHGKSVEWERLEFKAGWNPLAVLHTLCAFANDFHNLGGGYVVIGVCERDGHPVLPPVGLSAGEMDAIQKELLNLGHGALQPFYHPIMVPAVLEGKQVLVLWAPGGQTRPYKARLSLGKDAREWAYFIRKGSSTVRARGGDEQELLTLAATVPFDDRVNQRARLEDLSRNLIREFLTEVGSDLDKPARTMPLETLGRQMNIVGGPKEAPFPLNVGLLFFNAAPHRFFPTTQIDVVWFPEGAGGDRFTEKVFQGPIHRMLREALDFIRRNYLTEIVIKHPDRAEATRVANFPYAAIEEALANAIYHRSYEEREPVEVRISAEELIVLSYPGPDRSVRLEQLRAGRAVPRRYRNRRIGEFLKELEITEGRSTGIPKILAAMKRNGSPPPDFEFDADHSYFMTRLPVHPQARAATGEPSGTKLVGGELTGEGPLAEPATQSPTQSPTQSSDPVERLLRVLFQGEQSSSGLRKALRVKHRPTFRKNYLHPAMRAGFVELTIPDKPNSRRQKYRLTENGRTWLKAGASLSTSQKP
ncbi:MAG: transcriptional regulator [Planctomycetes bacterium]|nr:transcriptional regulator [Verrucomicrobiota bacterium]MBM4023991.1 transcriptional regulator [Planctomycetota bacterium]